MALEELLLYGNQLEGECLLQIGLNGAMRILRGCTQAGTLVVVSSAVPLSVHICFITKQIRDLPRA